MNLHVSGNDIADTVLRTFDALPNKVKPRRYPDGSREWTTLSGIVLSRLKSNRAHTFECVALGTGLRCLPHSKLHLAQGNTLHDWHAEIVAIRAFNLFLLQDCMRLANDQNTRPVSGADEQVSRCVRLRTEQERTSNEPQPFAIEDGIGLHMYSSTAPCGDASMELTMASQADATPWPVASDLESSDCDVVDFEVKPSKPLPSGRSHFSLLGIVRRKPARADAPPTLSKSCSDKLAMMQCTSLLSGLTTLFIHPANGYLHNLIMPQEEHVPAAMDRAFGVDGRMSPLAGDSPVVMRRESTGVGPIQHGDPVNVWRGGYAFRPFSVLTTNRPFEYSRHARVSKGVGPVGSNITAAWTIHSPQSETIINGTRSGHKQFSVRGASSLSRRGLWKLASNLASVISYAVPDMSVIVGQSSSYAELKACGALQSRRDVKRLVRQVALRGWTENTDDGDWALG